MNICYLADARAEHTRRWTRYFALKGHRVDLITLNPDVLPDYEPVRLHIVRKPQGSSGILSRMRNLPSVLAGVRRIIRNVRPDVLHAHSAGGYAWLAMVAGFHPYLVTPWGTDILVDARRSRWNRFLTTKALRRADLITCDAYHVKDEMVRIGLLADKIRIVFFGTDMARFDRPADAASKPPEQSIPQNSHTVISTRTQTPIHDIETFVRSVPLVQQTLPGTRFVLVGDGSERRQLEELVAELGVSESVRFVGYVDEEEMVRWLQAADVYVSTSLEDAGLAASTAEAMACGLSVVVTDNADNRKWVEDGAGGFVVPMRNPEVLADRVIRLLMDDEMRAEFGRLNRQVIEERNNYVTEMGRMEAIYEELAHGPR